MNSRVVAAIAAAVLALVGIGAVVMYASNAQSNAFNNAELKTVYRMAEDINANATVEEIQPLVTEVRLPNSAIPKGAISNLAEVAGLKTTVPLVAGEILVKSRFDKGGSAAASGSSVPKGLQEVTISLGADTAGEITAGQRVGIILTVDDTTRMFAQNVLVTRVSQGEGKLVTFAVNGKLATEISAAVNGGSIRLTSQNDDSTKDGGNSVKAQNLVK